MSSFQEKDYHKEEGVWKKIFKTVLNDKKDLFMMLFFVIVLAILDVVYPLINTSAIDKVIEVKNYDRVYLLIIFYAIATIAYGITVFGFLKYGGKIEVFVSYQLRKESYENLQKLPFSYFDRTPQGWLMARMTSDSRKLANILSWGMIDMLWGILNMIGILIVIFFINVKLALIILILMPILLLFAIFCRRKMLKHYRSARKINSQITAAYNEGFMGSKTTKSLVIENDNKKEFNDLAYNYRRSSLRAIFFQALFGPVIFILGYTGVATTLFFGGKMVLNGVITVGVLYLFIDYTIKFFDPVMQVSRVLGDFQNAQASAERIVSLINTIPEIQDTPEVVEKYGDTFNHKKENWEELVGDVEFKDVTFKYNEGETVLKNFNLKIKHGQSVALVGHTGSGKSTIVNLICRFYEPTSGEILIDGRNYKERSVAWLHSNIGYVLQSPQLFSGTIMENIRYGNLEASDDDVINAAKIVNAHDFIMKMDKGYQSIVGEGGNNMSLGEKQLISFARAIIADPKILILDEATSSIDTLTEESIQSAIAKVMENRTSFAIAHRLSTIVNSDLILVLDKGEVVESGTHEELLNLRGYYFELYKNQFMQELSESVAK